MPARHPSSPAVDGSVDAVEVFEVVFVSFVAVEDAVVSSVGSAIGLFNSALREENCFAKADGVVALLARLGSDDSVVGEESGLLGLAVVVDTVIVEPSETVMATVACKVAVAAGEVGLIVVTFVSGTTFVPVGIVRWASDKGPRVGRALGVVSGMMSAPPLLVTVTVSCPWGMMKFGAMLMPACLSAQ